MAYQEILNSEIQQGAPIDAVLLVKVKENDQEFNSAISTIDSTLASHLTEMQRLDFNIGVNSTKIAALEANLAASDLIAEKVKTASYTLDITDRNKLIAFSHATVAGVFTVPTNAIVAFPIGTQISFVQTGAAQLSIAGASGVTVSTEVGLKLNAVNAMASIIKVGTDTWRLTGSLKA
jgi:hypothetical protein